MIFKYAFYLTSLLLTHKLFAVSEFATENLVHSCKDNGFVGYNCQFSEIELIPEQDYETDFTVSYKFSNCGVEIPSLGIISEKGSYTELSQSNVVEQVNIKSSLGPLSSKNLKPDDFILSYIPRDCTLNVVSILSTPSENTISTWVYLKQNLEEKLKLAEGVYSANKALSEVLPAFEVINSIVATISNDLSRDIELREKVCQLTSCDRPFIASKTVFGSLLLKASPEEKDVINQLHSFIYSLPDIGICQEDFTEEECEEFYLNRHLSEDEIEILEKISNQLPGAQEAESRFKEAASNIVKFEDELSQLKALTDEFINWD